MGFRRIEIKIIETRAVRRRMGPLGRDGNSSLCWAGREGGDRDRGSMKLCFILKF